MKTLANRPWRKDHARLLLLAILAIAPLAPSAQAATGGAATPVASGAQAGWAKTFTPMRWAGATWYGPGLYGNRTACGQTLRPQTKGVAHRALPCGSTVKFAYRGRQVVTRVIDRGPFSRGKDWDLTHAVALELEFVGVGADRVGFAVSVGDVRKMRAKRRAAHR